MKTIYSAHSRNRFWTGLWPVILAALTLGCSASTDLAPEVRRQDPVAPQTQGPEGSGFELLHYFGCSTCHKVPDSSIGDLAGPRLDRTGDKLREVWLRSWLRDPKVLRPDTLMPRVSVDEPTLAVLEPFLLAQRDPQLSRVAIDGEASRGEVLFEDYDCLACHHRGGEGDTEGVTLDRTEERLKGPWLVAYLQSPDEFHPGTDMPDFDFTPQQAGDLSAFLLGSAQDETASNLPEAKTGGLDAFVRSGCAGCHLLEEARGDELGAGIGEEGIDFHRSPSRAGFTLPLSTAQITAMSRALTDPAARNETITAALWESTTRSEGSTPSDR